MPRGHALAFATTVPEPAGILHHRTASVYVPPVSGPRNKGAGFAPCDHLFMLRLDASARFPSLPV
ncbi:hypothetical protein MPL3356_340199 [Mesorhizobium plurifarium]|uniref:Uncharacterized protein n=1 Tax=Mesorhizobium plurifarium TaxID=69974 RepID=A0A090DVS0_MESPL|nr:hypothetical protein MPL3356_340199 [Mesorhizobium plurifarium]